MQAPLERTALRLAQMADEPITAIEDELRLEAYGVRLAVSTNSTEVLERVKPRLPPGWTSSTKADPDQHLTLTTRDGFYFDLAIDGEGVAAAVELEVALDLLEVQLRFHIAQHAPGLIFVHAGVVGYKGRGIVIPGPTFSGKTTLVSELVRAGADYYSDDYAVLDGAGQVHPYAKPLSIRGDDSIQLDHDVAAFGGVAGETALPVGLVIVTNYRPGSSWGPVQLSPGEGVLALLANTVPAQERPAEALTAIRAAIGTATALDGDRGEAADIVGQILGSVRI